MNLYHRRFLPTDDTRREVDPISGQQSKLRSCADGRREPTMATRRQHSAPFKATVAVAALRGNRTMSEMASAFGVHPVQVAQW